MKNYLGHRAHIEIIDHGDGYVALDEIWFSDGPAPSDYPHASAINLQSGDQPVSPADFSRQLVHELTTAPGEQQVDLLNWLQASKLSAGSLAESIENISALKDSIAKIQADVPRPKVAIAMTDGSPENEYVFIRGNPKNLGEVAEREMIAALSESSELTFDSNHGSGRMYLAERIADSDNPLTARVVVNRLWHHLTGRGLVKSVDNFGVLGSEPTHPDLLDYLATEFVNDGWSIKQMIKRIVLSQTYGMSSESNPAYQEIDPDNDYLHHFRIRRMQGEAIRDSMLQVSGRLDRKMYGPSIAIHLTPFMQGRGRPGKSGPLDGLGRRSIYIEVRRNFLQPMMLAFDTPIPFNSIGRRNVSNVPAQALILMNDPFVVEQAKVWSQRLMTEADTVDERIQLAYQNAFGRFATEEEMSKSKSFLQTQARERSIDDDKILQSADIWADFCHVLFNVKEFIYLR